MKKYYLEFVVFVSGFIGMGLELIAARVLSPYVGSSNVVWTSIIGIILLSMSIGYYVGGKLSKKNINRDCLANILLSASVSSGLIILFETLIIKNVAKMVDNLTIAAIICALLVFSIPSLVLAMISPCAVKLKTIETKDVGDTSGRLSSISTIGSIVGTFVMGFLLIPYIGISNLVLLISVVLFIISFSLREKYNGKVLIFNIIILLFIVLFLFLGKYLFIKNNPDIVLDIDSQYSRIWIKKNSNDTLSINVDGAAESSVDIVNGMMTARYLYYYDLFEYYVKDAKDVLMIGGAGYTYPRYYLKKFPEKNIDVVEIDDKMTDIAKKYFNLDTSNKRLTIYSQDGRSFLNYSNNKYDAIFIDAFKGSNVPFELTTYEALLNAKKMLNDNGVVLTNIICSIEGSESRLLKYEYATYKKVFDDVKVIQVSNRNKKDIQNIILVGLKNPNIDDNKFLNYQLFLNNIIDFDSNYRIVTDDFAPVGA